MYSKINKRNRLLSGVAAISLLAPIGSVMAQDEEVVSEVTVTGIRQSIKSSISTKRNAEAIVEAISAEDIGKLPDVSIADSISRLPGLAAQRIRGRSSTISVRGLGPDFTTALLNGREQVTTSANRGVEFDQYPAELINSVQIYKSPTANLVGQALAGTTDMKTVRPLDYNGQAIRVSGQYESNENEKRYAAAEDDGHRLTASYIGRNEDETIGWMVAFASQSTPIQGEFVRYWGHAGSGDNNFVVGGFDLGIESRELERDSFAVALDFEPNEKLAVSVDLFQTDFEDGGTHHRVETPTQWGRNSGNTTTRTETIDGSTYQRAGTFMGVGIFNRNDLNVKDADLLASGINVEYQVNEQWTVEFDYGYSEVDRSEREAEAYSTLTDGNGSVDFFDINFDYGANGYRVGSSQTGFDDPSFVYLGAPANWGGSNVPNGNQAGFDKTSFIDDELETLRLSAIADVSDWEFDFLNEIQIGINMSDRTKRQSTREEFLYLANGMNDASNYRIAEIPSQYILGVSDFSFAGGFPGQLAINTSALIASDVYTRTPDTSPGVLARTWSVEEDVLTLYAMGKFESEIGTIPASGNYGLQLVDTEQSTSGYALTGDAVASLAAGDPFPRASGSHSYDHILPSVNIVLELQEDVLLKLSAAKVLARARMDQIRASQEVDTDNITNCASGDFSRVNLSQGQTCLTSNGGNPNLKPYEADQFDISYERYFADGEGSFAFALFHKELKNYVDGKRTVLVHSPELATVIYGADAVAANPEIAYIKSNVDSNASDAGWMRGYEFSFNVPLTGLLENWGISGSYSFTDSEVDPDKDGNKTTVPGLSRKVQNASLWYDDEKGLSGKISMRKRDSFLGEIRNFDGSPNNQNIASETIIDAQLGYEFQQGQFEGLSILLQANNLTDEDYVEFSNTGIIRHATYGATYILGVSYKY